MFIMRNAQFCSWLIATLYCCCVAANEVNDDPVLHEVRKLRSEAMLAKDNKQFIAAADLLEQAIKQFKTHVETEKGASNVNLSLGPQLLNEYGGVLISLKKYEEAVPVLQEASELNKKLFGTSHPAYSISLRTLAEAHASLKHHEEAYVIYKKLRVHIKKGLGPYHQAYLDTSLELGRLSNSMQKYKRACRFFKRILQSLPTHEEMKKQNKAKEGFEKTAQVYLYYSTALARLNGNHEKALSYAYKARDLFAKFQGQQSIDYAFSLNGIAGVLSTVDRYEEALVLLKKAHQIAVNLMGKHHPMSRESQANIKKVQERIEHRKAQDSSKDEL